MRPSDRDPIVAVATAPGRGGVGIVRLSGRDVDAVATAVCGRLLEPRVATYVPFRAANGDIIERGLALFFPAPHSYTGEDVLELHAHGGPVLLQMLVARCLEAGAGAGLRLAEPGEFTRRAFVHDKLDLAQAEAVADLIEASTEAAARSARASLEGVFSRRIVALGERVIELRMLVEATLDFPEEEIEFLERADAHGKLGRILSDLDTTLESVRQGALLRQGVKVVLAGRPNVGKSSLLNALAEAEVAIVTPIAGTTRDRVTETIQIEGIALHVVDTAGLRPSEDLVERLGIERSWREIDQAGLVLHVRDATDPGNPADREIAAKLPADVPRLDIWNKIDLLSGPLMGGPDVVGISALTGAGVDFLRRAILAAIGWHGTAETAFMGRQRHIAALQNARNYLEGARAQAAHGDRALELLAEELRLAHEALMGITGEFVADDLLGEIFSRFCIGK